MKTDGDKFETNRSLVQDLTFNRLEEELYQVNRTGILYDLSLIYGEIILF